jgi:POT family proton-dependent oligopeptide transporter
MKILDHPKGLYFLFFTEMFEKFSFFGMRSLLVFYMTKRLLFEQAYASNVYGFYTGLIYFTPFVGGILSDRFLGRHASIIVGGILMSVGYFFMMYDILFYPALLLLILGSGAISPNIILQVHALYKPSDYRHDNAFSIFYLGINLGAIFSPLICGTLGELYGWSYGFGAAGVGMVIGLVTYITGQKYLQINGYIPKPVLNNEASGKFISETSNDYKKLTSTKNKVIGLAVLIIFGILFRAVYGQQGNTLAIWVDTYTNRHILGWEIPASWFQSFNPLMVVLFTPLVTQLWAWQAEHSCNTSHIMKMAIGCIMTGISFLPLIPAVYIAQKQGQAHILFPTSYIFILTVGELYVCPIALLLVAKIAPAKIASMVVGLWYMSYFAGNCLSGFLGGFWEKIPKDQFFLGMFFIALMAGVGLISISKLLNRILS